MTTGVPSHRTIDHTLPLDWLLPGVFDAIVAPELPDGSHSRPIVTVDSVTFGQSPQRSAVLAAIADEVADRLGRVGRSTVRASVDGFHNPRAVRYARGRDSPDGFYRDSYNVAALESELLRPLGSGGTGDLRRHAFDHARDEIDLAPVERAAPGTVLVLDGIFLHRPELAHWWTWSLWLEVDVAVSVARCAERDGTSPDPAAPGNRRYVEGQRLYLSEARPRELASCVVDNNDLAHPVVLLDRG